MRSYLCLIFIRFRGPRGPNRTDMKTDTNQSLDILGPLKFLLTCSELDLDNFELSTLGNLANLKSQAADVMESMLRETSRLDLVRSIRASSPDQIKKGSGDPSRPNRRSQGKN